MKFYLIGGLGADKRVFKNLIIQYETHFIHWITPLERESLKDYVSRLSSPIEFDENYGFIGVSFGGIIAIEMAKILKPKLVILISSVQTSDQLPKIQIILGRTGILSLFPQSLFRIPNSILNFIFGAKDKALLHQIVADTNPSFIKWALISLVNWRNDIKCPNTIRIHGTNDLLIPLKGEAIKIEKGGHFMVVDKAEEVSRVINHEINSLNL